MPIKVALTYRCDSEGDMDNVREAFASKYPGYEIVGEKKDYKTKKSKGEIIDEFWLYTITATMDDGR